LPLLSPRDCQDLRLSGLKTPFSTNLSTVGDGDLLAAVRTHSREPKPREDRQDCLRHLRTGSHKQDACAILELGVTSRMLAPSRVVMDTCISLFKYDGLVPEDKYAFFQYQFQGCGKYIFFNIPAGLRHTIGRKCMVHGNHIL